MRVLVCGSRTWNDLDAVKKRLAHIAVGRPTIVHGGAAGADQCAGLAARTLGLPVEVFPAQWDKYGRRAGILRNLEMLATKPDLVLAFWDGRSPGTKHTIEAAKRSGIPVEIVTRRPRGEEGRDEIR